MTQALMNAQHDNNASMYFGGPNQSMAVEPQRQSLSPRTTNTEVAEGEPTATEGQEGEMAPEGDTSSAPAPVDALVNSRPVYDKDAMEDLAPAERQRINMAIAKQKREAREKMIEEMVAKMKEGDPDALDEDIRSKINKELALKKN